MNARVKSFLRGMAEGYELAGRRLWPLWVFCVVLILYGTVGPEACSACERPEAGRAS